MKDSRSKKICLLLSEDTVNNFVKKTKDLGIKQNFVVEALLKNWMTKEIDTGLPK